MSDSTSAPMASGEPLDQARIPDADRQHTFSRRVVGLDVVFAFLVVVLVPGLAAVLVIIAGAILEQRWLYGLTLPLATVVAFGGLWVAFLRRGWSWRDLGFVRAGRSLWSLLWEVPLVWVAALVLTVLVGTLAGVDPSSNDSSTSSSAGALNLGVGAVLVTAACVTFVMPALEEILFRRVLFGWLEQRLGVTLAVVGSALSFGVVHIAPPAILLQFLIGLGAATLVRAHKTLWASLALHALNNGIVTAGMLVLLL